MSVYIVLSWAEVDCSCLYVLVQLASMFCSRGTISFSSVFSMFFVHSLRGFSFASNNSDICNSNSLSVMVSTSLFCCACIISWQKRDV